MSVALAAEPLPVEQQAEPTDYRSVLAAVVDRAPALTADKVEALRGILATGGGR